MPEISGSKRSRANSFSEESHNGVSRARYGWTTAVKYCCSMLAICNRAQAENNAILIMTRALELSPLRSPISVVLGFSRNCQRYYEACYKRENILAKFSKPTTRGLKILPILSTFVTIPVETNVAQTLIASEASSGDESAAKAGVRAEPICAWYCSRSDASLKSGSGVLPNIFLECQCYLS